MASARPGRRRFVGALGGAGLGLLAGCGRLPTIAPFRGFAEAGGLLAYGPSLAEAVRRSAYYVDRILSGTPPADLPVE
jgi:putative ABC transport system substrate-binding protein